MTPRDRVQELLALDGGPSAQELAEALLATLLTVTRDDPTDPATVAALGHAAAVVALLPIVSDEDDAELPEGAGGERTCP